MRLSFGVPSATLIDVAEFWVKGVAHRFADEIVRENGEKDGHAGEHGEPPVETAGPGDGLVEKLAPAWLVDEAEPEEAQDGFKQDRGGDAETSADKERGHGVGEH